MDRGWNVREQRRRASFIDIGLVLVLSAASFLLFGIAGDGNNAGAEAEQVILAFGLMSAGLLLVMYGMQAPGARAPGFVRRAADVAGAVLWPAGGPERLLLVVILLVLEAWFDFFF